VTRVWCAAGPRASSLARSGASRRSNLAGDIGDIGDIASNAGSASSVITSSWKRRSLGTNSAMIGANRFLVGTPSTAQQNQSAAMISAPEIRHRAARGRTGRTGRGVRAFLAWLPCQPPQARPTRAFLRESTTTHTRAFLMSQRGRYPKYASATKLRPFRPC